MPDDAATRGLPTVDQLTAELNSFRTSQVPVRQTFDADAANEALAARIATRDRALAEFNDATAACTNAIAAVSVAAQVVEGFSDLEEQIAAHYGDMIAYGQPPALTPALEARRAEQRAAVEHRYAVHEAQLRLQRVMITKKFMLDTAEEAVNAAACMVLRIEGEALAERCAELRRAFIETRNALMNLGAVRLGNSTMQCSQLWTNECRDPVPEAALDGAGIRHWVQRACALAGRV